MIVTLTENCTEEEQDAIVQFLKAKGYSSSLVRTQVRGYVVAIGQDLFDIRLVAQLAGVHDVHRVSDAFKLVSRKWKASPTKISLATGATIVEGGLSLMAGPCSIESREQAQETAKFLHDHNVPVMRGGAFKPRTSPYSFQGLGIEGLKMFFDVARSHGRAVVSEVVSAKDIDSMIDFIDIFQVGTRNSQNFDLLHALGETKKPVLLKRAMSGTLEELLQSAEYIFSKGNENIMLCERGIRTFEKSYRNTLDLNAVPLLKEKSHLPVIVDPSHGIGIRRHVSAMALAAIVAGADGLIVEIHQSPDEAFSDGQQTLGFEQAKALIQDAQKVFSLRNSLATQPHE